MRIQVNSGSSVEGSDALTQTVDTAIHAALDRYSDRIPRAEVHLSVDNQSNGNDPEGSRCHLEAQPAGMELVVTGTADTIERACHDAAEKMQRLLESTFEPSDFHRTVQPSTAPTQTMGEIPRAIDLPPNEFLADLEVAVTNRMRDPLDRRAA